MGANTDPNSFTTEENEENLAQQSPTPSSMMGPQSSSFFDETDGTSYVNPNTGAVETPIVANAATDDPHDYTDQAGLAISGVAPSSSGAAAAASGAQATGEGLATANQGAEAYDAGYGGAVDGGGGSAEKYVTPEQLVQNQLTSILSEDSDYMRQAEARGRAESQARGWSSSTAGVSAVEGARIAAAMPMAQQNAETIAQAYQTEQQGDITSDLSAQQADQMAQQIQQNADVQTDRDTVLNTYSLYNMAQQAGYTSELSFQSFSQQMFATQQGADIAKDMATINYSFQDALQNTKLTSQERQAYSAMMGSAMGSVMQGIMGIMNNPDIEDKDAGYKSMWDSAKGWIETIGDLFGYEPDWSLYGEE